MNKTVIQIDTDGNEIFSSSAATFSNTKEQAKNILGSAERIGKDSVLIADSINKRAIIVGNNDKINWEYESDRFIMDIHCEDNVKDLIIPKEPYNFVFVSGDGFDSSFTASIVKIGYWGNIIFKLKNVVSPKDVRSYGSKIIVSV